MIGPEFERLSEAMGIGPDDLRLPVTLAALYSALLVAVDRWRRQDGREDLLVLVDNAFMALAAVAADLRETVRAVAAGDR